MGDATTAVPFHLITADGKDVITVSGDDIEVLK